MNGVQKVLEFAEACDGILFANEAAAKGISREYVRRAAESGLIESVVRGVYVTRDTIGDDAFILQKRYPKAIFSHETAGYYLGYTTRDPLVYSVTIPSAYNPTALLKTGAKVYYAKEIEDTELVTVKTMFGRDIVCFNIEKTICDLCSARFDGDKDVALEIIKAYVRSKEKNIPKLMRCTMAEKTKETIRTYMEILL